MSKIIPPQIRASGIHKDINGDKVNDICENALDVVDLPNNALVKEKVKKIEMKNKSKLKTINRRIEDEKKFRREYTKNRKNDHLCEVNGNMDNEKKDTNAKLRWKSSKKVGAKENKVITSKIPKHIQKRVNTNKLVRKNITKDPLISRFEKVTDSIKQRCNMLSKKVEDLLIYKNKRKQKLFVNETVQYSNIIKDNKNVSVRKKIEEIVLHDYVSLPPKYSPCSFDNRVWDGLKTKPCKSTYDLVRTILKTQQTIDHVAENVTQERASSSMEINALSPLSYSPCSSGVDRCSEVPLLPKFTYDSHINRFNHFNFRETVVNNINKHFITTQSIDNFVPPCNKHKTRKRYETNVRNATDFIPKSRKGEKKSIFNVQYSRTFQQESVTIDFSTKSDDYLGRDRCEKYANTNKKYFLNDIEDSDHHLTYTLKKQNCVCDNSLPHKNNNIGETYTLDTVHIPIDYNNQRYADSQQNLDIYRSDQSYTRRSNNDTIQRNRKPIKTMNNVNVVFVSESQECLIQGTSEINVDPLEICEIVHSREDDILERSLRQKNDSLFNDEFYLNSSLLDKDVYMSAPRNSSEIKDIENASHHFNNQQTVDKITTAYGREKNINIEYATNSLQMHDSIKMDGDNFKIRNRLRFVPKGNTYNIKNSW